MNGSMWLKGPAASAAVLICFTSSQCAAAQTLSVNFRGVMPLGNTATDQNGQNFTVTGLSGLTWAGDTLFVAVMDNSDKLVFLNIELASNGAISQASIGGGLTLADSHDFEGIAYTTAQRDSVFLSEEGTPAVHEYALSDGAWLQTLVTPPVFFNRRANLGFESLSRHPVGTEMWTANEEALTVDGAVSTPQSGTTVRLLRYILSDEIGTPAEQFAHITAPMHGGNINGGRSGLVDLAVLPNGKILALERSFAFSV
ncbi:MAG: esterase-like activity of phytase family protein, partial [Phycisphaerae bacterium]